MRYKALGEGSGILRSIETESPNVTFFIDKLKYIWL